MLITTEVLSLLQAECPNCTTETGETDKRNEPVDSNLNQVKQKLEKLKKANFNLFNNFQCTLDFLEAWVLIYRQILDLLKMFFHIVKDVIH